MPIDPEGEKWACEPCIRGHRSTKCEHFDRFMMRVKRPGRPLSKCPHPKGKCSCAQEKVLMVRIPRDGLCLCEPAANVPPRVTIDGLTYSVTASPSKHKVQKYSQRPGSTGVAKNVAQAIARDVEAGKQEPSPWVKAEYESDPSTTTNPLGLDDENGDQKSRLQLGMMGVGGYRAKDEIGWQGSWPEFQNGYVQGLLSQKRSTNPCCSASSNQAQSAIITKTCCGSQHNPRTSHDPTSTASSDVVVGFPRPIREKQDTTAATEHHHYWLHNATSVPQSGLIQTQYHGNIPPYLQALRTPSQEFVPSISMPQLIQDNARAIQDPSRQQLSTGPDIAKVSCHCGDQCQCIGCAVHPGNDATRTRLQELDEIMDLGEVDEESEQSRSRSNTSIGGPSTMLSNPTQRGYTAFHPGPSMLTSNLPNAASEFRPGTTESFNFFNLSADQAVYPRSGSGTTPNMLLSDHAIMRPSAYITMEYPFQPWNYCTDFTGSCRCGDDCACVGCLTHSGHLAAPRGHQNRPSELVPEQSFVDGNIGSPNIDLGSATENAFVNPHFPGEVNDLSNDTMIATATENHLSLHDNPDFRGQVYRNGQM